MRASIHSHTFNIIGRTIALAAVGLAIFTAGTEAEETMTVTPSSVSSGSPQQWVFDGAETYGSPGEQEFVLSSGSQTGQSAADLYLSFDGDTPADPANRWSVETVGPYERSPAARFGAGAGSFRAPATKLVLQPKTGDVFPPNMPTGDMSLEFWLKPTRADSGEIVFMWKANRKAGKTRLSQQVSCIVLRNRIVFGFLNFFGTTDGKSATISLKGLSALVPGVWSHHLVRFDSATGLVEYLMNGKVEAVAYATSTGKQAGTVFTPIPGDSGRLELASNYTGLLDEFRLSPSFNESPMLRRYPAEGGSIISPIFDLGATNSTLLSIDADARTPAEAAVHWSYRIGDSAAGWREDSPEWMPFFPGSDLTASSPKGRYIQLKLNLYADATGERSPAVSSIGIHYEPDTTPTPPSGVYATPGDGRIVVRWQPVFESDIGGYMIYYGLSSGDYFGTGAAEGPSPVVVRGAGTTSVTLHGLKNGALYFIAVAAYDDANPPHIGEFSRETNARPSRVSP